MGRPLSSGRAPGYKEESSTLILIEVQVNQKRPVLVSALGRVDERHRGRSRSFSRLWCGGRAVWLRVI
jgi:hypothetical protein